MNDKEKIVVDLNTAAIEELTRLPGVGRTMAERIIQERPFVVIEDLMRVSGISTDRLEKLRPMLSLSAPAPLDEPIERLPKEESLAGGGNEQTVEAQEGNQQDAPGGKEPLVHPSTVMVDEPESAGEPEDLEQVEGWEAASEDQPAHPEEEPAPEPAAAPTPPAPQPAWVTRSQAGWMAFGSALFAAFCALVLSLGILAALNNGRLQFASPSQVNQLSVRLDSIETQINTLSQDQENLRVRLSNLESLAGRVTAIEIASEELNTGLKQAEAQVERMSGELQKLAMRVEGMQALVERFTAFFNGLRELINQTIPQEAKP